MIESNGWIGHMKARNHVFQFSYVEKTFSPELGPYKYISIWINSLLIYRS